MSEVKVRSGKRSRCGLLLLAILAGCVTGPTAASSDGAEWTLMVFMNGDNNLEEYALKDFDEMAKVGSSAKVNLVVQLDRIGKYDQTRERWTQTLRFLVKKGMKGVSGEKREDLGETNMGDGKTLEDFVKWSMETFPAKHYGLVIWDHGQGWRRIEPAGSAPTSPTQPDTSLGPFRAASHDESSNDQLYNAEMVTALTNALKGRKLELLGFDACLMAMVETGYAFRKLADVMVGSEELEPGDGWHYKPFLEKLQQNPQMSTENLAEEIVTAYGAYYESGMFANGNTTQSAMRLSQIDSVATTVDALGKTLQQYLEAEEALIKGARNACKVYAYNHYRDGDRLHHIDLIKLADELSKRAADRNTSAAREIVEHAAAVRSAVQASIIRNYRGKNRDEQTQYGSSGIAIYFPATGTLYRNDTFAGKGYEKDNTVFPVEFVRDNAWPDFLHAYFRKVP